MEEPEIDLNITSEEIESRPRRLSIFAAPLEPSAVDRMSAIFDPEAAERVAEADALIARIERARIELKDLWGPDLFSDLDSGPVR